MKMLFYTILIIGLVVVGTALVLYIKDPSFFKGWLSKEAQLPNPAAVYCEEQGGTLESRQTKAGTKGFCLFEDESECNQWEFFREECKKGERFCKDMCGDGECGEYVCMALGCPCSETAESCAEDCPPSPEASAGQAPSSPEPEPTPAKEVSQAEKLYLGALSSIDLSKNYSFYTYTLSDYECKNFVKTVSSDEFSVSCEYATKKWKYYYVKEIDTKGLDGGSVRVSVNVKDLASGRDNEYYNNVDFAILETNPYRILSRECNKVGNDWSKCSIDSIKGAILKSCSISKWTSGKECSFNVAPISADRIYLVFSVINDSDWTNIEGTLSDLRMAGLVVAK